MLFDHGDPGQFVRDLLDSSGSTLARAAAAIGRVEQEVDVLWRDALSDERREVSERLVEVGDVLHRALRLLEGHRGESGVIVDPVAARLRVRT